MEYCHTASGYAYSRTDYKFRGSRDLAPLSTQGMETVAREDTLTLTLHRESLDGDFSPD